MDDTEFIIEQRRVYDPNIAQGGGNINPCQDKSALIIEHYFLPILKGTDLVVLVVLGAL